MYGPFIASRWGSHPSEKICASQIGIVSPKVGGENKISLKPQSMYGPFIGSTPPRMPVRTKDDMTFF